MAALAIVVGILIGTALGILVGNLAGWLIFATPRHRYPWNWRVLVHQDVYFDWLDSRP